MLVRSVVSPSPYGIVICGLPEYAASTHSSRAPISCARLGCRSGEGDEPAGFFEERLPPGAGVTVCWFADVAGIGATDDDLPQRGAGRLAEERMSVHAGVVRRRR